MENGLACVERLHREDRDAKIRDLRSRIQAAEREGRIGDALRLAGELDDK
jgi:hypothetical protein